MSTDHVKVFVSRTVTTVSILTGLLLAVYLFVVESPRPPYLFCQPWSCGVVYPDYGWYQPILFLLATVMLGRAFWRICLALPRRDDGLSLRAATKVGTEPAPWNYPGSPYFPFLLDEPPVIPDAAIPWPQV